MHHGILYDDGAPCREDNEKRTGRNDASAVELIGLQYIDVIFAVMSFVLAYMLRTAV